MKVKVKNNKWIIAFNDLKLECDIEKINDTFIVEFLLMDKKIRLKTQDLDETFITLEKIFNRREYHKSHQVFCTDNSYLCSAH